MSHKRKKHLKNCIVCDDVFYASNRGKNTRKYCSAECRYKKHKIKFFCETCDNEVIRTKGNVKNKVYCSKECSNQGKVGVSINTKDKIGIECPNCFDIFYVLPCHSNKKFCRRKCADEFKTLNIPEMSFRTLWEKSRVEALKRDGYTCTLCGLNNEKHIELYGRGLNVHHIVPHHIFKVDNENQHSLENLQTVCTPCHRNIHKKLIYTEDEYRTL